MMPLSGSPSTLTVIQNGKVRTSAMPAKHQAARNLPMTASERRIGNVRNNSIVPLRRSSAQSRIDKGGISTREGERGREIAPELAAEDGEGVGHQFRRRAGAGSGQAAR